MELGFEEVKKNYNLLVRKSNSQYENIQHYYLDKNKYKIVNLLLLIILRSGL